jgi:hypothetical protein
MITHFLLKTGKHALIPMLALALSLASCKKPSNGADGAQGPQGAQGTQGTQGPAGPSLSGSLKGYVNHYDIAGSKVTTDLSGDSVYVSGTNFSTVTDVNGMFSFSGISTGVYDLIVKKSGGVYGSTKVQNIEFAGNGDTYRNASMSAIPTNSISTFMAYDTTINSVNYVRVRGTLQSSTRAQSLIMFVNTPGTSSVTPQSYSSYYTVNVAANATTYAKNIPTTDFYDLGFTTGNTLHLQVNLVGSNTSASSYVDFTSNRTIFTALSTSYGSAQAQVQ